MNRWKDGCLSEKNGLIQKPTVTDGRTDGRTDIGLSKRINVLTKGRIDPFLGDAAQKKAECVWVDVVFLLSKPQFSHFV